MYVEFCRPTKDPFGSISPRHICLSSSQRNALAELHYGLEYGHNIQLLLADDGLGKTTLLQSLAVRLKPHTLSSQLLFVDAKGPEALNRAIGDARLDTSTAASATSNSEIKESPSLGRDLAQGIILLIDDAHALTDAELQRILRKDRLFSGSRVSMVLAGCPALLERLERLSLSKGLRQVRVSPLDIDEVEQYVRHRLRLVGAERSQIFAPAKMAAIATQSRGLPKAINNLCAAALDTGVQHQLKKVDAADLDCDHTRKISQVVYPKSDPPQAVASSVRGSWRSRPALSAPLLLVLVLVLAVASIRYERPRIPKATRAEVSQSTNLPRKLQAGFAQSVLLMQAGANNSGIQSLGSVATSQGKISAKLTGALPATGDISHGPTSHIASVRTTAGLVPTAANPKLAPFAKQAGLVGYQAPTSAIAIDTTTAAISRRARVRMDAGDDSMQRGEYEKAIADYEAALALLPGEGELQRRIERARRAKAAEEHIL
ncbi:MAG TPA: AAA family ATPase [Candidatus Binataceae bacterium]|nr:AAA family ATPase [Candidatus Binataceae bacterium]